MHRDGDANTTRQKGNQIKGERLVARITADQRKLFARAAALEGRSLSDFVITSVQEAARRTIHEQEIITLGVHDSAALVEGLLNPPPINDRLRETVERYQAMISSPRG